MKTTEMTFYTRPCTWMNDGTPEPLTPYDMVAGISIAGQTLWADKTQLAGEAAYRETDTEATKCVLPRDFAERTADYFYDFYANPLHPYRVSHVMGEREHISNCHRFATTLLTQKPQTFLGGAALIFEMFDHGVSASSRQRFGELAILGSPDEETGEHIAHVMTSLGEALPERYLQVVTLGGSLGISGIADMLSFYGDFVPDLGVYSSQGVEVSTPQHEFTDYVRKILSVR